MALEPAGVVLQAQNSQAYLATLERINKAQQQAFDPASLKAYQDAAKRLGDAYKDIPKNIPKQLPLPKPDEADKLRQALETLGRTGKYTMVQISEETRKLNEALQTVRKSGQFKLEVGAPEIISSDKLGSLTKSLDDTFKGGNKFNGFVRSAIGDVNDLTGMITGLLGKFTLVAGVLKVVNDTIQFFNQSVAIAQRNETLSVSLQEIGTQAGYSNKQIDLAVKLLNKQGITTQAASQSLLRMARANISWAEASKLAAIAQGSAVVAGINSSDAFERLVTGIQKQEPELLDELSITLRREVAYKAMAEQLGVNTKQLTDAQKQQAILNSIYEQSQSVLGVYGAAMETSGKQQASMARYIEETQNNFGKLLLPLTAARVEMETNFWKAMQQLSKGLAEFKPILDSLGRGFEQFIYRIMLPKEAMAGYDEARETLKNFGVDGQESADIIKNAMESIKGGTSQNDLFKELTQQFKELGAAGPQAETQAKALIATLYQYNDAIKAMPEQKSFWERIGEGIYNFARLGAAGFVAFVTAIEVGKKQIEYNLSAIKGSFEILLAVAEKDYATAATKFMNLSSEIKPPPALDFGKEFESNMAGFMEKFPQLYKSWDELNETVTGSSDDLRLAQDNLATAVEDASDAIENQIDALEASKAAYNKIKDIQENFQDAQAQAKEDYEKGLAQAEEKYLKERAQKIAEFNQKLAEFDAENARKRQQMIEEYEAGQANRLKQFNLQQAQAQQQYDLKVSQDKRKFYDDQKRQLRAFQLSQMQEQRRFQIDDRRLRADGDVLALMEARENFELSQQEKQENFQNAKTDATEAFDEQRRQAQENFDLQQQMAKDSFALQTEMQREEFQRRLQEFDENVAMQREKMIAAHQQELADLELKFEEEKVKLGEQYQERMAMAEEQRNKQLQALGDGLKEEGKLTEEGMKEIADKISELFGSDAAGDQLIKGWSERSENEINNVVDAISAQIEELKAQLKEGTQAISDIASTPIKSSPGAKAGFGPTPNTISTGSKPIGARSGFNGTVTGPKTFQIEPGVHEHVAITPANRFNGNIKVSGSTQHNITGVSQQNNDAIANQIADTLVGEIRLAVRKLARRGS